MCAVASCLSLKLKSQCEIANMGEISSVHKRGGCVDCPGWRTTQPLSAHRPVLELGGSKLSPAQHNHEDCSAVGNGSLTESRVGFIIGLHPIDNS